MLDQPEEEMSFLDHLEELRWRIVKSVIAILVVAIGMWFIKEWAIQNLFIAMTKEDFISFRFMCDYLGICIGEIPVNFQSTNVGAQFSYALLFCFGVYLPSCRSRCLGYHSLYYPAFGKNVLSASRGSKLR